MKFPEAWYEAIQIAKEDVAVNRYVNVLGTVSDMMSVDWNYVDKAVLAVLMAGKTSLDLMPCGRVFVHFEMPTTKNALKAYERVLKEEVDWNINLNYNGRYFVTAIVGRKYIPDSVKLYVYCFDRAENKNDYGIPFDQLDKFCTF